MTNERGPPFTCVQFAFVVGLSFWRLSRSENNLAIYRFLCICPMAPSSAEFSERASEINKLA